MQVMDDMALLRAYATHNSEAAFETLVSRRVSFVYSAALRQVRDPHLAEEVTQAVFIILAQKAGQISDKTILSGWLFKTTRFAALAQTRADVKRQQREQEACMQSEIQQPTPDPLWEQMSPLLDEALVQLGEADRQAILLRFVENKSLAEVGRCLGAGEDTARKRVARALEKLRGFFLKRGVVSTTAIIAGAISANSVQAAPAVLTKSITAVAMTKGVAASGSTLTLIKGALKIMAWTKMKMAVVGAVILTGAATTAVVMQHQSKPAGGNLTGQPISWEKAAFANAGYQTPQATLMTMVWATSNGDTAAFLNCFTPEAKARQEQQWRGRSKEELTAEGKQQLAGVTGIKILDQTMVSQDRAMVTVLLEGTGRTQKMPLTKIGNEWKVER